jgi:hypothetical protein
MRSKSTRSSKSLNLSSPDETFDGSTVRGPTIVVEGTIQSDVENLIKIAARLFSAIEGRVHALDDAFVAIQGEPRRVLAKTIETQESHQAISSLDSCLLNLRDHLGRVDEGYTKRRQNLYLHSSESGALEAS